MGRSGLLHGVFSGDLDDGEAMTDAVELLARALEAEHLYDVTEVGATERARALLPQLVVAEVADLKMKNEALATALREIRDRNKARKGLVDTESHRIARKALKSAAIRAMRSWQRWRRRIG